MSIINRSKTTPYNVYFNSRNRIEGTESNFVSTPIDLGINTFDSVCLVQATVPRSFYNIPSQYCSFTVLENLIPRTVTLPTGSYNKNNLRTALIQYLNTFQPVGWVYDVYYPPSTLPDTFKYTFSVTGNAGAPVSFVFTNSMFRQLGFDPNTTNDFIVDQLSSQNAINLSYATRCFIKSNVVTNTDNEILEDILSYGSYPMGSMCYYQQINFDLNTKDFNKNFLNSWNFVLVDGFGQEIDLNGISWSFTLVFYHRNDTHELQREDLKIKNEERLIRLEADILNIPDTKIENILMSGEIPEEDKNKYRPVFPVLPYGSSSILENFLPETVEKNEVKKK